MRAIALLLVAIILNACGDSTGPDPDAIRGLYLLETYGGRALPATLDASSSAELTDGWMEFETATQCTLFVEVTDADGPFGIEAPCTYEVDGSKVAITLDAFSAERVTGTWSRAEVRVTDADGVEWVFRRQ